MGCLDPDKLFGCRNMKSCSLVVEDRPRTEHQAYVRCTEGDLLGLCEKLVDCTVEYGLSDLNIWVLILQAKAWWHREYCGTSHKINLLEAERNEPTQIQTCPHPKRASALLTLG